MQTFFPDSSMVKSMELLDSTRLGKQRIEAARVLEILLNTSIIPSNLHSIITFDRTLDVWSRHPIVLMWKGHEEWLKLYLAICLGEWGSRGFENEIPELSYSVSEDNRPLWIGYEPFHRSHRSNLVRKDQQQYGSIWPEEIGTNLPYFWPTNEGF